MPFAGKSVLITGAGSGIGRATALLFAKSGARVAINNVSLQKGNEVMELIKSIGAEACYAPGDISVAETARAVVEKTLTAFGKLDILVNNAGIVIGGRVDNTSEEDLDRTLRVNVRGTFLASKYAVQEMKKRGGGVIVNVASVAAIKGIPDRAAYSASKGALVSLTKAMAADYIKDNIRVNCVCPGTTFTEGLAERIKASPDPEAALAEFVRRQPMGRLGKEEEIAHAILFAACDEAAFMTGSIITIDGGASI
jgi:NAD(P)-dependent dehydrogenase (short-subunit alcohol dehydrogenase family)